MAKVFLSYNRRNEDVARSLVKDIEDLGHQVWFDQELSGGQSWWNKILESIRNCDVFVFVLGVEALDSVACRREYSYAADLGKPILPALATDDISTNLLPPALSQIQFVDYREQDRDSVFRLARSFTNLPQTKPLPDPPPVPPDIPISYLGGLFEQIESPSSINYEEQVALLVDLKRTFRQQETAEDARQLFMKLRKRRDLYARVAEEIDEIFKKESKTHSSDSESKKSTEQKSKYESSSEEADAHDSAEPSFNEPSEDSSVSLRARKKSAIIGGIIGTVAGMAGMLTYRQDLIFFGLLTGLGGAIAGAMCGTRRLLIILAGTGAVIGWIISIPMFGGSDAIAAGAIWGALPGAFLLTIAGLLFLRLKNKK